MALAAPGQAVVTFTGALPSASSCEVLMLVGLPGAVSAQNSAPAVPMLRLSGLCRGLAYDCVCRLSVNSLRARRHEHRRAHLPIPAEVCAGFVRTRATMHRRLRQDRMGRAPHRGESCQALRPAQHRLGAAEHAGTCHRTATVVRSRRPPFDPSARALTHLDACSRAECVLLNAGQT